MRFMLLIYGDEHALTPTEREECYRESRELGHKLDAAGHYLASAPLHLTATASSVRVRAGKQLVTDGPFAETREVLGGYYIIDVENLDEAIRIAERHPGQRFGGVEIRPILEIPNLPVAK